METENCIWISAVDYDVTVRQEPHRVSVALCPTGASCGDDETGHMLMSVILLRMADASDAEYVEWLTTKSCIPMARFLSTFDPNAKEEATLSVHPIFSPVEDTAKELDQVCDRLTARNRQDDPVRADARPDDERDLSERLICWGMTFFAALIFAPLAVAMAFVNVIRGEDFRRNAHALTMTFALIALTSGGALAGAFQLLAP